LGWATSGGPMTMATAANAAAAVLIFMPYSPNFRCLQRRLDFIAKEFENREMQLTRGVT
jgi:hypothetical protein